MALFNIGFVIFPDLTQLDFTGPLQVLSRVPQSATHIVAKSEAPVPAIAGWASCQRTPLRIVRPSTCSVSRAEATESSRRSAIGATHEKARVVRDGNVITLVALLPASILGSLSLPRLPARELPKQSSSVSNTTRRHRLMLVIPIGHRRLLNQRCYPAVTTSPGQHSGQALIRRRGFD